METDQKEWNTRCPIVSFGSNSGFAGTRLTLTLYSSSRIICISLSVWLFLDVFGQQKPLKVEGMESNDFCPVSLFFAF